MNWGSCSVTRCWPGRKSSSVPTRATSECLVYFIRASRRDNNEVWFERLYRILTERVLRSLRKAESSDGKKESLTRGTIRDKVFGRFVELLSADRADYVDKLDYFKVRFDGALASLRRDAQENRRMSQNRGFAGPSWLSSRTLWIDRSTSDSVSSWNGL